MKLKLYCMLMAVVCFSNYLFSQNTFPSSGKVGIGTTTPNASSLLEVKSTTKGMLIPRMTEAQRNAIASPATSLIIYQTDNNPGFFYYTGTGWLGLASKINTWNVTGNASIDSASNFIGTTSKVPFSIRTNNTERVHVSSNGNVGIGVTSPAALLHINGRSAASLNTNGYVLLGKTNDSNFVMDNYQMQARYNDSTSDLYLNQYGGTVYAGNLTNSEAGLIGIGSNYGLEGASYIGVFGDGQAAGVRGFSSEGTGVLGFSLDESAVVGNSENSYGVQGTSVYGIGVYGETNNSSSYAGYFEGNVYTTGTYTSSDEKLKQNITDMTSAMSIISKLKPKYYNFRQDNSYKLMNLPQGQHYGLIAQDVEKILPGLVKDSKFDAGRTKRIAQMGSQKDSSKQFNTATSKDEIINFKALNYTELIPIIIKGMQEMNAAKDASIDSLKAENNSLNERLTKIEAMLNINTELSGTVSSSISSASLQQNIPNPFNSSTTIGYNLPSAYSSASIIVTDAKGVVLKQINLNAKGKGNVQLDASTLAAGAYRYTLYIDGKMIDSKQMISSK